MTRPQIILFDVVGTLLYPAPSVAEVYFHFGKEFGSRLTIDEVEQRFPAAFGHAAEAGGPGRFDRLPTSEVGEWERWRQIVCDVFDDIPEAASGGLFFALWEHFVRSENWGLFDDVVPTLELLAQSGYRLGAASNFDRRLAPILRAYRPLRILQPVFVSSDIGFPKPSPRFFAGIEEQLGMRGAEIALIGDDVENDYLGALDFGWQAVLLDRNGQHAELPRIASLEEILPAFDRK